MIVYCKSLNLTMSPLINESDIVKQTERHVEVNINRINPVLHATLKLLGVRVSYAECFRLNPYQVNNIHTDTVRGDYIKINWIYGGKDSTMSWYTPNTESTKNLMLTATGTTYENYELDEVTLVHKQQLHNPSLVQVGVPHDVQNYSELRYALSFVIAKEDKRLTMNEAIELFSNYIID
jgi:hypothetical protein